MTNASGSITENHKARETGPRAGPKMDPWRGWLNGGEVIERRLRPGVPALGRACDLLGDLGRNKSEARQLKTRKGATGDKAQ